jgi:hypothetical protein|tara:strand:+ start:265 stop:468 length:204 start_codon:yes stop_codon:yes gene_type:complete
MIVFTTAILSKRNGQIGIALMVQVFTLHQRQELLDQSALDENGSVPVLIVYVIFRKSDSRLNPSYLF